MQICYVLYFTLIAYLLAVTIPGSQERWSALNMNVVSLISHIHSTTSTTLLSYCFSFVTSSLSAEKRFSSAGRIDVCRLSPLRTDGTCHPLDSPTTPTPTLILNTSATRTGSAIAASPIGYNPTPYNDAFFLSLDTRNAPRKSEGFKSRKDEIPSNSVGPSCLLSAMTSTMIIVQCLMVFGEPVVRYLESFDASASIPNSLEFRTPKDRHRSLVLSWISASSLIPTKSTPCAPDDETNLKELSLWFLYFATILVRYSSKVTFILPPPTSGIRTVRRQPLMIEAQTSREATEVLLFRWFRTHARLASSSGSEDGPKVELAEPKAKRKFIPSLPILELQPAVQPQAPDVVHPHILPNANSFHLADYIDKSWSEIIYPNQREGPSPTPRSDTSSIKTELSHPRLSLDISEPTLLRPFERISGRRTIPHVQSDPGQVSHTSEERTPFSLLEVISLESLTREFDLGLLSAFPAPPKPAPVRPPSLLKKLGIKSPFSWPSLSPTPDSTPSSPQALRTRLERGNESHSSLSRSTPGSAHELERDSSMYYGSSSQSSNTTSVIVDSHDRSPSPDLPPRSSLIPSVSSRWNFLTKSKQKPKARKVSALFASSKSPAPSHGKENVFPKNLSHRVFGNG